MASNTKWVTNLRKSIKILLRMIGQSEGVESKVGLITQVTFRYPDNQGRNAKSLNLAWNAKNTTKIITAVEALNELVKQNKFISKKSC